jgi:hypothetical protein
VVITHIPHAVEYMYVQYDMTQMMMMMMIVLL